MRRRLAKKLLGPRVLYCPNRTLRRALRSPYGRLLRRHGTSFICRIGIQREILAMNDLSSEDTLLAIDRYNAEIAHQASQLREMAEQLA